MDKEGYNIARSPDEWVSEVDSRVQEATNWIERRQMMVNMNYYVGNQWITWDNTQRQVVTAPNPYNQERITHNVLRQRILSKLAKQIKSRIKFDVMPETNDEERLEVSKAGTKFVNAWWNEQELDKKTRDIFLNGDVKGWCALKTYFDTSKGDDITPEYESDNDEPTQERIRMGEIVCRVIDGLCLYVDPSANTDEDIRWIAEEIPRDVDYVESKYGKKVTADPNVNYLTNYDVTLVNSNGLTTGGTQRKAKNMVLVRELWIKPCEKYPKGLKVTTTKGEFLDLDEEAGDLPYQLFGECPVPGSVKYQAALQDMLPIQRTINIAKTMMATHLKRMGNSMWAIPIGSDVDEEMLTNDEGGMFYYNGTNGQPMRVPPNDLPSFFDRIIEFMMRDLDDMSGSRELAAGSLPAGLDTASGLSLMVEQENEKLAVSSQNYERGMEKVLTRVLRLIKKHYTEERQVKILGDNSEVEVVSFTGSDLSGSETIHIVPGSSLPEMKSAQQDRIMTMWKMNAIVTDTGMPDHKKFLQLMDMGDSKPLFEQDKLDENKSKMENNQFEKMSDPKVMQMVMMYQGQVEQVSQMNQQTQMEAQNRGIPPDAVQQFVQQPPPKPEFMPNVRDFQNHQIHIYQHNNFRKSDAYDKLPKEIQAIVDAHVKEHEDIIAKIAQSAPPPPEVKAQQEENELEKQKIQLDAKNNQEKNQITAQNNEQKNRIEVMKLQADKEKTAVQLIHSTQMSREKHGQGLQTAVVNNSLRGGEKSESRK